MTQRKYKTEQLRRRKHMLPSAEFRHFHWIAMRAFIFFRQNFFFYEVYNDIAIQRYDLYNLTV